MSARPRLGKGPALDRSPSSVYSETKAWRLAMDIVSALGQEDDYSKRSRLVDKFIDLYAHMKTQAQFGYHKNPLLVIHGNPRHGDDGKVSAKIVTVLSDNAHDLRYTHATDGEDYEHEFGDGVRVLLVEHNGRRDVLLTHADGKPLWENF